MGSCLSLSSSSESSPSSESPSSRRLRKPAPEPGGAAGGTPIRRRRNSVDSAGRGGGGGGGPHGIPGRIAANGASGVASLFTQQGKKGTNQDAMIVWENFGSRTDTVFCGVFDGHGPYGHLVARRVRDLLPLKLSANLGSDDSIEETPFGCLDEEISVTLESEKKEKQPDIFATLKKSFLKAFKVMDKELKLHGNIDCLYSGTTAVTVVKQDQDLVIGNLGDSRAVLGTRDQNNRLIAVQLTVDLKPNLPREAERIRRCRGRVFALRDEPEVARVWLPNCNSPGLAMARAFGDFCLKEFGIISVPEVSYRRITERDEFIVLATDGVWDVLTNKEVVDIVASAPSRSSAARSLVESAIRAWRFKYPTSKSMTVLQSASSSIPTPPTNPPTSRPKMRACHLIQLKHYGKSILTIIEKPQSHSHHESNDNDIAAPNEGEEWSALEGVSRMNTLLTLPRFAAPGGKQP
uniref:protein-serine/threonine phosphatase n=1 Tax=Ananas comosus var. bracteatus TaxID=296719 RepID=A0A6V7Q0G7_ANACO|nr:unnamed protein product [Ananas comosus var. bracteatus]